jgi:hypothetical protein
MNNSRFLKRIARSYVRWFGWCRCLVFLLLLWAGSSLPVAGAALLTFDDLTDNGIPISNGYGGLQWSNFYVLNAVTFAGNPSGYLAGMITRSNVAYNAFGSPARLFNANPFDLNSGYFTAAWNDGLHLEVKGYIGLTLAYDNSYTLSAATPSLLNFNYVGVTAVDFISSGGTPYPPYGGNGTHFAMDNLTVTIAPEPSGIVLLMLGMLGLRKLKC